MSKYEIAEIAAMNDLDDGEYRKLTAAQQREMFGVNVLGRKSVCFDPADQGTVRVAWYADATETEVRRFSYEQFSQVLAKGEKIS